MATPYKPDITPKPLLPIWWWLICGFFATALPTFFIAASLAVCFFFVWPDGNLSALFSGWTLEMVMRAMLTIGLGFVFVRLGIAGGRAILKLADVVGCCFMRLRQKSEDTEQQVSRIP